MRRLRLFAIRAGLALAALAAVLAIALSFEGTRSLIARLALSALLAPHGMHIAGGDLSVGFDRIVATDLEIDGESGRVLSLRRLDLQYDWRAFLGRSDRRFGLRGLDLDRPALRVVVLPDGSTSLSSFVPNAAPQPANAPAAPALPFDCHVRVRDGRLDVEDPTSYAQPGRVFAITGIEIDAALHRGRNVGTLLAHYQTRESASEIRGALSQDDMAGFADLRLVAHGVAIAPLVDAFVSTPVFALQAGIVDVSLRAYDVGYSAADGPAWRLSGNGYVRVGSLSIDPLAVPIRDISGPLTLQDGFLGMPGLRGEMAGVTLGARGSVRLLGGVRIAVSAQADGDLRAAHALFPTSRYIDVTGPVAVRIRVDGPPDDVRVGGELEARGTDHYGRAPLGALRGVFYAHEGHVTLLGAKATYAGGRVDANGDVDLTGAEPRIEAIATSRLPVAWVPVAANLNRDGDLQARASVTGPMSTAQYSAFARTRGGQGAAMTIAIAGRFGQATVGAAQAAWPGGDITVRTGFDHADPSNRTIFASLVATHAPVMLWAGAAQLPGVTSSIALPAMSGTVDGAAALHGSDEGALHTVAALRATRVRVAGAALDDVLLRAHGTGPRIAIDEVAIAGHDVRARASGVARIDPRSLDYAIALRGSAAADLSQLSGMAGVPAGSIDGVFEAAMSSSGWAMSLTSRTGNATIAGLPFRDAYLVATGGGGSTTRFGARAGVFGGDIAALGTFSGAPAASIWASGIDAAKVAHAAGVPLDAGTAVMIGAIASSTSGPALSAGISLAGGRVGHTPLGGDADVTYRARTLHALARVDVAGSRARVTGDLSNIAPGEPLSAIGIDGGLVVLAGDVGGALAPFMPPTAPMTGTFDATFSAHGPASAPDVDGTVRIGAGTFRGVTFTDTAGSVSYRDRTFALHDGRLGLGSTRMAFDGLYGPGELNVRMHSAPLDLTDFNDFFGGSDVFEGTGHAALAVSFVPGSASARGDAALADAAVVSVPLGAVAATFSGVQNAVHADISQSGALGQSQLAVAIGFPRHAGVLPDLHRVTYDVSGRFSDIDLAFATRFGGFSDLGLRGQLNATGRARGTLTRTDADVTFAVHDAHVHKLPLDTASGTLRADDRGWHVDDAVLAVPFGRATGAVSLARGGALSGGMQIALTDLGGLASFAGLPGKFAGSAAGTLTFAGTEHSPEYHAALRAGQGTALGIAYDDLSLHATYSNNKVSIGDTSLHFTEGRGTLALAGTLPLQLTPLALGPAKEPVHLALTAQHVRLNVFDPLVSGLGTIDGMLEASASASGLAGRPQVAGSATLRDGTIAPHYQSVPLRDVSADLALSNDSMRLLHLTGRVGDGSFDGSGAATIVPAVGLRTTAGLSYWATLHAHNIALAVPDWVLGTLNGDLSLTQPAFTPYLAGTVALRDGTIPFSAISTLATTLGETSGPPPTRDVPGVPPLRPGHMIAFGGAIFPAGSHLLTEADLAPPPPTIFDLPSLDLDLATKVDNVRVRGGAVDITASGALDVNGSVRDPRLSGGFTATRGHIGAFGVTMRIVRGELTWDPDGGVLPVLDATAVTDVQGDRITVVVSGRVDRLNTEMSSSQGKTPEQILTSIVTGTGIGELSGGINQQTLASGATQFMGNYLTSTLLNPFANALAQTLNVEQVSFGFTPLGQPLIEIRKYVSPTVAVLYSTTTTAPVTQAFGIARYIRDRASVEFATTMSPSGFEAYLLRMRLTFQ
jgi:autotransporter translocation and assembly factor TamB